MTKKQARRELVDAAYVLVHETDPTGDVYKSSEEGIFATVMVHMSVEAWSRLEEAVKAYDAVVAAME